MFGRNYMAAIGLLTVIIAGSILAQEPPQLLSSTAILIVQTNDGRTISGNGFLVIRDGIIATAWHVVRDAKKVTAKFPDGEAYDCSGILDKDESRNAALVRIKAFGRPLLKIETKVIASGTKLFVPIVKDGTFVTIQVAAGDTQIFDDRKYLALVGDVPPGNSGSPVVDQLGAVVGFVTLRMVEKKPVAFVFPVTALLALDTSLPTQPWGQVSTSGTQPTPQPAGTSPTTPVSSLDEVDAVIGESLIVLSDNFDLLAWAYVRSNGYGFRNGVPSDVYQFQQSLDRVSSKLAEVKTDNELRMRVIKSLSQMIALQKGSTENFIRGVVMGQQTGSWGAQSQDAQKRSSSLRGSIDEIIKSSVADFAALEQQSTKFRESLFPHIRYRLRLLKRQSGFMLGVESYARNPFYFSVIYTDGIADKMGFKPDDTLLSAMGKEFVGTYDLELFKILIKENLGKKIDVTVKRDGKIQKVTMRVPKEIPPTALYTQ